MFSHRQTKSTLTFEHNAIFQPLLRYREGYDLPDADYELWKASKNQQASKSTDRSAAPSASAFSCFVTAGLVSEELSQILVVPAMPCKKKRSAASKARSITTAEFQKEIEEKKEEKKRLAEEKEKRKQERLRKQVEAKAAKEKRREEIEQRKKERREKAASAAGQKRKKNSRRRCGLCQSHDQPDEPGSSSSDAAIAGPLWLQCENCNKWYHFCCLQQQGCASCPSCMSVAL